MKKKYSGVMPPLKNWIEGYFEILGKCIVDGDWWYTVQVDPIAATWVKQQPRSLWYDHLTPNHYKVVNTFDIHEKVYTLLALRWS